MPKGNIGAATIYKYSEGYGKSVGVKRWADGTITVGAKLWNDESLFVLIDREKCQGR